MWERALRLLALHDRSEQELRARLEAAAPATTVEATIRRLQELQFLDDRRLSREAAERSVRRGHGSDYVRAQLAAKGVDEAVIDAAVTAAFGDEVGLARQALMQRYPTFPPPASERPKAARFLLRRGFPEAVVFAILEEDC